MQPCEFPGDSRECPGLVPLPFPTRGATRLPAIEIHHHLNPKVADGTMEQKPHSHSRGRTEGTVFRISLEPDGFMNPRGELRFQPK